jgi:hypothetical protein
MKRSILVLLAVIALGGCFSQLAEDGATITIQVGGGSRAVFTPDDATMARISFTAIFTGQSTVTVGPTAPGTRTISASVEPGHWSVTVTAYLDGKVYAEGSASFEAQAGQSNKVPVTIWLNNTVINIAAIEGVYAPVTGAAPATAITETAQYTGIVTWNGDPSTFAAATAYTATITLTAKTGYTLQGVAANFFTVAGATVSNAADTGVITAVFSSTIGTINKAAIQGVTAPVTGAAPATAITENEQYTGTVTWNGDPSTFAAATVYTATITLTAKTGYTLQGVATDFFKVEGATTVNNSANSGVITAVFPETVYAPGDTGPGGGKIFYVNLDGFTMTDNDQICYYLEAAPADMNELLAWASSGHTNADIVGTETGIGTGRKNTALILATDENAPAAKACADYRGPDNLEDWFLPSKDELNMLYENKDFAGITGTHYYPSSQYSDSMATNQDFRDGAQGVNAKPNKNSVRAIRAF